MSKSHPDPDSRILITDHADQIRQTIIKARTDSLATISYDPKARPAVSNLLEILSHFEKTSRSCEDIAVACKHMQWETFKQKVADAVIAGLAGIRERYERIISADDGRYVDFVAAEGAKKARQSAEETMRLVRSSIGL